MQPAVGAAGGAPLDRRPQGRVGAEPLCMRDGDGAARGADQLCRPPGQATRSLELGRHVGEAPDDALVLEHRLTEDVAPQRVARCDIESLGGRWRDRRRTTVSL